MILTRALRVELEKRLKFKLKVNDCIRLYLKSNHSVEEIVDYVLMHRNCKRKIIPANMHYNRYVKWYWANFANPNKSNCVALWKEKYREIFYKNSSL